MINFQSFSPLASSYRGGLSAETYITVMSRDRWRIKSPAIPGLQITLKTLKHEQ